MNATWWQKHTYYPSSPITVAITHKKRHMPAVVKYKYLTAADVADAPLRAIFKK